VTATTTTPEAPTAGAARRWVTGRLALIAVLAAGLAATLAVLLLTVTDQSSQITALRGQIASAQRAAATAQAKADAASSAAAQVGKTQAAATNANLGVCVSYTDGYPNNQTVVTSPIRAAGGAVSCYSGTFTPVSPQPAAR
jgi:hypothetical protein